MNKRLGVTVGVLVVVAAALAWVLLNQAPPFSLANEATSPPGSPLPDGLAVPADTVLLGPVLVERQEDGTPLDWQVVLAVEGDPLEAWRDLSRQLAREFPDEGLQPEKLQGCRKHRFSCYLTLASPRPELGIEINVGAQILNAPDDVTGRYLMVIRVVRFSYIAGLDFGPAAGGDWTGGKAPAPRPPRSRPGRGDPLAPSGAAYDGDTSKYVLLPGSELVAHYGEGSITGGFEVLLRVHESADVAEVAHAYADRANRGPGDAEERFRVGDTTYTRFPAGPGAGGYSGAIWAVDSPGKPDYIFYNLFND